MTANITTATTSSYSLAQLAEYLAAQLFGDPQQNITHLSQPEVAQAGSLIFINTAKHLAVPNGAAPSAVLIAKALVKELDTTRFPNYLVVPDAYVAYAKVSKLFKSVLTLPGEGVDASSVIGSEVQLGQNVRIGPFCVISSRAKIGDRTVIGPGCYIGEDVVIGEDCVLYPRVTLYHQVKIGKEVTIHSGTVIGSDGFGYANDKGTWHKIYQLGSVVIGDQVEIGANTTIDRGALLDTTISSGVKLDNLIQIAHNVHVGANTAMAAGVGIAGSTKIGKYCMLGGKVGVAGHITIADQVVVAGGSLISNSITEKGFYASSIPAIAQRDWWRVVACLFKLPQLLKELKAWQAKFTFSYWWQRVRHLGSKHK